MATRVPALIQLSDPRVAAQLVYIKRDETPLERAQTKKLNVLRKSRTEESRKNGENVRWFIRREQVVNGKPRPGGAEGGGQS